MHRFQDQACCFACVVWAVPLEHILSQPLGVHACLMSHNAFMKRSLLSEVLGGHSGAVWMLGSYAIPLHNSNFDFACMSKGSLTKSQNENQAVFSSRVSGARALGDPRFTKKPDLAQRSQSLHTSPKTHQSPWRRQNHQSTQRPSEPQESTEPPKHAKPPEVPRAPGNPKAPRAPQTRRTEKSPQRNQPEPPDPCDMTSAPGAPTHTTLPMKKTQLSCCSRIDGTLNEKRASVTACACVLEFNTKLLHVHLYS